MKTAFRSARIRAQGSALVAALIVIMTLAVAVAASLNMTSTTARNSNRARRTAAAASVADGAMEVMYANWKSTGRLRVQTNQGLPTSADMTGFSGTTKAPGPSSSPTYPEFANYTFNAYSITAVDQYNTPISGNPSGLIAPLTGRPGWIARTYNYLAKVTVSQPTFRGNVTSTIGRRFQKADAPIFQAAIFYEMDLEVHPGADMNVTGLVHSNGNLYAAAGGSNDGHNLTFSRNVSFAGDYSEGFAPGDDRTPFNSPVFAFGKDTQLNQVNRLEPVGTEPASVFNTTDTNQNNDGFRELIERPSSSGTDPAEISSLRFYNQAGLRIVVDSSLPTTDANRIKIYNGRNVQLTSSGGTKVVALINAVKAAVSSGETIRDNREANNVLLTTLDLSQLSNINTKFNALNAPTSGNLTSQAVNTSNNVIYICDASADPSGGTSSVNGGSTQAEKAIRLKNGATLPNDLTIASENPVYIQGDYNTGGPSTLVPTNLTTETSPITAFSDPDATGYTRKSCAVLADAVNILSNNWNDAKSSDSVSDRVATNTTVNTAILSGVIPTDYNGNGAYSGGAENFPRFLEDWGDGAKNFTYYGSMVSLFVSKQGNGPWGNSNVYGIPSRRWFFDNNFIQNPPPGTLQSVTYSRGRWMQF